MRVSAEAANVEETAVGKCANAQVEIIANRSLVLFEALMVWNVIALRGGRKRNLILKRH